MVMVLTTKYQPEIELVISSQNYKMGDLRISGWEVDGNFPRVPGPIADWS